MYCQENGIKSHTVRCAHIHTVRACAPLMAPKKKRSKTKRRQRRRCQRVSGSHFQMRITKYGRTVRPHITNWLSEQKHESGRESGGSGRVARARGVIKNWRRQRATTAIFLFQRRLELLARDPSGSYGNGLMTNDYSCSFLLDFIVTTSTRMRKREREEAKITIVFPFDVYMRVCGCKFCANRTEIATFGCRYKIYYYFWIHFCRAHQGPAISFFALSSSS